MREDKLAERSMEFAVQIIELTKELRTKKEYIIANQVGRSGTSIGANIREAHYAQSRDDFISKLEIALKEANETWVLAGTVGSDKIHFRTAIPKIGCPVRRTEGSAGCLLQNRQTEAA